jgi:nucleotide-binding universal stress UspA family protein
VLASYPRGDYLSDELLNVKEMEDSVSDRTEVIVAGVAFSPHAQLIAATASRFSALLGARTVFVHVGEEAEETRVRLADVLRAAAVDSDCELLLRTGSPEDVLLAVAEEQQAALMVTGALEEEGMFQRIFGSVARRIARKAGCPVLLIPLNVHHVPKLEHVVMGVRFGEDIAPMLSYTLNLLRAAGEHRLHIVQETDYADRLAARYVDQRERDEFDSEQYRALIDYLSVYDLSDFEVEVKVLDDSAEGIAIVEYARSVGSDLVITQAPSRALTFWDRVFTHPAESALTSLPCGMLLYRGETDEKRE